MRNILIGIVLSFFLLHISVYAEVATIPNFGPYPQYGDGFLYLADGGYAELDDVDVTDIDYSGTSFSVEAAVDTRSIETIADWSSVLLKGERFLLYNANYAGWGIGFGRSVHRTDRFSLTGKVGDGTQHVTVSQYVNGLVHIIMTWDHTTQTVELFVDGVSVGNDTDTNIVPANIDNTEELRMGRANGETNRNILMVRWWGRKLSNSDITALYNNWANNGDDRVPAGVDTTNLHSEWLMDEESTADGSSGTGYVKDSAGSNHLQMIGNAELKIPDGEPLTMIYPEDGATGVDKSVTLKASGGDVNITGVAHPLLYFFQVDTANMFDSPDLKESGWIPHYAEYRPFLSLSTTYYWRVKVKNTGGDESAYTTPRSFTTEGATTWYVRPVGGDYGAENGVDYANAWDGLHEVVFGEAGVELGDTLHVCGLHYYTVTDGGYITSQGDIYPMNGREVSDRTERITIRGDCPGGNQGIVWGTYKMAHDDWEHVGNNVYNISLPGNSFPGMFFEDIGDPTDEDYTLLKKVDTLEDCQATPGSHYSEIYAGSGRNIYVHTSNSSDPTGRIWGNTYGYSFNLLDNRYLTFQNLKLYNIGFPCGGYGCSHIRWENCTKMYSGYGNLLGFYDNQHYMEIIDCELAWGANGIYIISGTNNASSNFLIKGNYFHDIGVMTYHQNGDAHAVGTQGANNLIVEDNVIERAGNAILFYTFTAQESKNNTIRRNLIKDCHTLGSTHAYGIATQCNNDAYADKSGTKIYQNIVINCTHCYRLHWEYEHEFYNNIAYNCNYGFASGRNYNGLGANVKLRNNIFLDNRLYHIYWYSGATNYTVDSDYNLFYPIVGDMFRRRSSDMNFTEWQAGVKEGSTFDPNSLVADPLFANLGSENFHLQPDSPAIDAGVFVGLTQDYEGNSIPQGNGTDMGAYEYMSGEALPGDLDYDGDVDIDDLIIVTRDFGRTSGFDPIADVVENSEIDIFDVVFVASRFS